MPDVGILNLQIHDDSSKAAEGLGRLATALGRVKAAIGSGLKLAPIANQIKKLNESLKEAIPEKSLASLERFANAVEKLNAAGGIKLSGMKNILDATEGAGSAGDVGKRIKESVEDGFSAKQSVTQESSVADAMTAVKEKVEETKTVATEAASVVGNAVAQVAKQAEGEVTKTLGRVDAAVKKTTGKLKQYNPATGKFEDTQYSSQKEWLDDLDRKREEANKAGQERALASAREMFSQSSQKVQEAVAHTYGMNVDELFPKGEMEERSSEVQVLTDSLQRLSDTSTSLKDRVGGVAEAVRSLARSGFEDLKKGVSDMIAPLSGFVSQLARVAKYRMLRAIIKQISEGFKEGIENYYRYSQSIKSSFAPAMDSAATSLLQMKNSIGAAVAPLIQSLIPYLQIVVNWFISLVNYANQFIALMRGQSTWSRATQKSAKAFDDVKKSAGGAAAAVKDLLADWDELNIIQSESGGGGGGSSGTKAMQDYLGMFEEVSKFDKGLKSLVDNIEKEFGSILDLVKEIGVALLAWKAGTAFTGLLGSLASLVATGAVIDLTFKISKALTETYLDTGNAGWLLLDMLTTMIGGTLAKKALTKVLGAGAAELAIPLTFAFSAIATIKALLERTDVSALSEKGLMTAVTAALEGGVAAGYLAHITGATLGGSLAGGAVGTLLTFGVAIGLKAIKQTVDSSEITKDTILADLTSAGAIGTGLAVGAAVLGGTAGTIMLAGAGGAIATFGLLIGIEALIVKDRPKKVMWGNSDLTSEQISAWVNENMFSLNVDATVSKINAVVNDAKSLKTDIESQMTGVLTDLNIIKLGLATKDTYESMKESLFGENGVISLLKTYAEKQKTVIKTSMTLLPIVGESGKQDKNATAEMMKAGLSGWTEVEQYMSKIGGELSRALTEGSTNGLDGYDDKLIATLTEKLTNVQRAVTGAKLSSTATGNLMENLSGLSQEDAAGILAEYEKYQKELESGYNRILTEEYESYQSLEAFYRTRGEKGDEEKANYYKGLADGLLDVWGERLKAGVKASEGPGKKAVVDALKDFLTLTPEDMKGANVFGDAWVQSMFSVLQASIGNSGMQNSDDVKEQFARLLDAILGDALEEADYGIVKDAIGSGLLNYTDLFNQDAIDMILGQWQGDNNPYKTVLQEAWADMLADALGGDVEMPESTVDIPMNLNPEIMENGGANFEVETEQIDPNVTGKRLWTTGQLNAKAAAGAGVGIAAGAMGGDGTIAVTVDNEAQRGNIQTGVQNGTNQILESLRTLNQTAAAINQKNFTVSITPSAPLGRNLRTAGGMFDTVTGAVK